MTGAVVCFGEMLLRLSPQGARTMRQADKLELVTGGAEANVAAALASLGHEVRMVTALPSSPLGERARADLRAASVDTRFVISTPGRMALYFLEAGAGLRPSAITYDRDGSAFARLDPTSIDFAGALENAAMLHLSGITPALGPHGVKLAEAATAAARSAGVPIAFDGNYRASLWSAWDGDARAILSGLVAEATIFFGNHRDIALLLGQSFPDEGAERRREAAEAAFSAFPNLAIIASTARHVVASDHHRLAARVDLRGSMHQTDEIAVTGIVDRIGTGDAFAAGVLHRYLDRCDARAMAETGLALAALKHSLPGDFCIFAPSDLETFCSSGRDVRR